MQIIKMQDLAAVPWKNGGGITREVAQAAGADGFVWRLSIADVETEGAFSRFAGMARILTVIEGDGLVLRSPQQAHELARGVPFSFRGDTDIDSVLTAGPIRDFNVIYDPRLIVADVTALHGPMDKAIDAATGAVRAVFVIEGAIDCNGAALEQCSCALIAGDAVTVVVNDAAQALLIELKQVAPVLAD